MLLKDEWSGLYKVDDKVECFLTRRHRRFISTKEGAAHWSRVT